MAGSVTIAGQLTATPAGTVSVGPYNLAPTSTNNYQSTAVTLASGANTITVPSWATAILIEPSTANVVALTLKGVTGDTGVALGLTAPSLCSFPASPPATVVLTAASIFTTNTQITFF